MDKKSERNMSKDHRNLSNKDILPKKPETGLFYFGYKVFLVIAVSMIPVVLTHEIMSVAPNCNTLTISDFLNSTYHSDYPQKTFTSYIQQCHDGINSIAPMKYIKWIFAVAIGGPVAYTLLKDDFIDNKKERYNSKGERTE